MGIRVQPLEVEVPADDPFSNDLLSRQEPAEVLTHLVGSIDGPCVLAIDGVWGSGKTTFLEMWTQHLINQGFPVVKFNAWETDYSAAPFISLATALTIGPQRSDADAASEAVERFRGTAKRIAPWVMPMLGTATLAAIGVAGGDLAAAVPLTETIARLAGDRLNSFPEAQLSVEEFKASFEDMAAEISDAHDGRPLIVAIDELDRCRPTFAIELLETAKHLFMADPVVFVLTMNREELGHSIKAVYGTQFDADGYLRRFIDIDFRLPSPERQPFIEYLLQTTGINADIARNIVDGTAQSLLLMLFKWVFADDRMTIRTVSQSIHHLSLVLASLPRDQHIHIETVAIALWLRGIDWHLYIRFVAGEASDAECVDAIFREPLPANHPFSGIRAVLEALIMSVSAEQQRRPLYGRTEVDTPLMRRYVEFRDGAQVGDHLPTSVDREHAASVLQEFERIEAEQRQYSPYDAFNLVTRRLGLLSSELITPDFTA